jgi:hypothetical protein
MELSLRSLMEEHYFCVSDIRTGFSHAPLVIAKFAAVWWETRATVGVGDEGAVKEGNAITGESTDRENVIENNIGE